MKKKKLRSFIDISCDEDNLPKLIFGLALSTCCIKALDNMKIKTAGDLVFKREAELLRRRAFKQVYINEIKDQPDFKLYSGNNKG